MISNNALSKIIPVYYLGHDWVGRNTVRNSNFASYSLKQSLLRAWEILNVVFSYQWLDYLIPRMWDYTQKKERERTYQKDTFVLQSYRKFTVNLAQDMVTSRQKHVSSLSFGSRSLYCAYNYSYWKRKSNTLSAWNSLVRYFCF